MLCENSSWSKKKVDSTLGLLFVSFCSSLCQSLIPFGLYYSLHRLLLPRPDTNIIPLWFSEARSTRQGTCLTSRFFLFHLGGSGFGKIALQDQHEVDGHLVYSVENPQMANTTQSLGSVSPNKHSSSRLQQSVRQAGRPAQQQTTGPRPNSGD